MVTEEKKVILMENLSSLRRLVFTSSKLEQSRSAVEKHHLFLTQSGMTDFAALVCMYGGSRDRQLTGSDWFPMGFGHVAID